MKHLDKNRHEAIQAIQGTFWHNLPGRGPINVSFLSEVETHVGALSLMFSCHGCDML